MSFIHVNNHPHAKTLFVMLGSICHKIDFRGIFMVKAHHLPRCVKGNLTNTKNDVGNFVICTGGRYGGSVFRPISINMESRLEYKMACK